MKFKLSPQKPRNPVVPALHTRHGGAHRLSAHGQRHQARVALQRELRDLHAPPRPSP